MSKWQLIFLLPSALLLVVNSRMTRIPAVQLSVTEALLVCATFHSTIRDLHQAPLQLYPMSTGNKHDDVNISANGLSILSRLNSLILFSEITWGTCRLPATPRGMLLRAFRDTRTFRLGIGSTVGVEDGQIGDLRSTPTVKSTGKRRWWSGD